MTFRVQYLRGVRPQSTQCWSFVALADDIEEAVAEARDVQSSAQMYWGAKSYRIVDDEGCVLSKGKISDGEAPPF
ncbi:MAG: hypothetical protein ABWZ40_03800 [Caulobacterales bacterium]